MPPSLKKILAMPRSRRRLVGRESTGRTGGGGAGRNPDHGELPGGGGAGRGPDHGGLAGGGAGRGSDRGGLPGGGGADCGGGGSLVTSAALEPTVGRHHDSDTADRDGICRPRGQQVGTRGAKDAD